MQISSDMNAVSECEEHYSLVATFTKYGAKQSGVARLFSDSIFGKGLLKEHFCKTFVKISAVR